jgi:hypothetical protein
MKWPNAFAEDFGPLMIPLHLIALLRGHAERSPIKSERTDAAHIIWAKKTRLSSVHVKPGVADSGVVSDVRAT